MQDTYAFKVSQIVQVYGISRTTHYRDRQQIAFYLSHPKHGDSKKFGRYVAQLRDYIVYLKRYLH